MEAFDYDVLVIGGGPAGTAAAAMLASGGHRVLIVEKERFPRFHIGESLLPGMLPYLNTLGVAEQIESAGFVRKFAADFITSDGQYRQRYAFAESLCGGSPYAYQVERAKFDQMLLTHALSLGAVVEHGVHASAFAETADGVRVELRDEQGIRQTQHCKFLLDASGQASFVGTRLRLRERDPALENFALFTQFTGVPYAPGDSAGDITVVLSDDGWWWLIPLGNDLTSVGMVAPTVSLRGATANADYFAAQAAESPALRDRLASAECAAPVRAAVDYSYRCRSFYGARWALAGDAAAFLDPVFSTGVLFGVSSGVEIGSAISRALKAQTQGQDAFGAYAAWLSRRLDIYSEFVKGFYRPEFVDLFMHPDGAGNVRKAVTSLLAGHCEDAEVLRLVEWFLSATRANLDMALSPRLPGRREAALRLRALRES